ncbi:MAG: hypothetical protein P8125_02965 [Gemmatimonadota bacterium]
MTRAIWTPLVTICIALAACESSDAPTAPASSAATIEATDPLFAAGGTIKTPVSFVTTFYTDQCSIPGYEAFFRAHGNSGRAKTGFFLGFEVTGDLVGTSCVYIDANLPSASGPQEVFTTQGYSINDVCIPSRGLCGIWESTQPGKVHVDPSIGVVTPSHGIMQGISGDAVGTKIQLTSFQECDPPGAGCAEGVLLEPGG